MSVVRARIGPDPIGFGERLAEALYRLDREEYGTQRAVDPSDPDEPVPLSDDGFPYGRAAVAGAGRQRVAKSAFQEAVPTRERPTSV
ncbi:hypothetical protein [Kitasatospora purpeofusca]|uniref:hypothetical protein n=1 Tax=Kitasatospora purpeofusca TaxID=67352 RepID=UPI003F4AAA32